MKKTKQRPKAVGERVQLDDGFWYGLDAQNRVIGQVHRDRADDMDFVLDPRVMKEVRARLAGKGAR